MTDKTTSEQFWEKHYKGLTRAPTGRPSAALVQYASDLSPGRSLDLGCSRGDDVIWLAQRGWQALGVDVSGTAVTTAQERADAAGLRAQARFERHDLAASFPDGRFDLVTALFLQSPVDFPRAEVLRKSAASVSDNGMLLIVEHASAAPWSWNPEGTVFPTAQETLSALQLVENQWDAVFVGSPQRQATGPNGQSAMVSDNILALRRRA